MFSFSSIQNYHNSLLNGQTTCVEAVLHYIQRIKEKEGLNAWLEVYETEALQRALELDVQRSTEPGVGKLHGVVVGLKDVICYKGHQVTAASKILNGFTSLFNSTATQRLLDEGAIIIGRQNCDEFAMGSSSENSSHGPVKNAADETRVPGGSSGGSGQADRGGQLRYP